MLESAVALFSERSAGVRKQSLETRVAHIESLLRHTQGLSNGNFDNITSNGKSSSAQPPGFRFSFGKGGDFLAPEFWTALSQEVAGLRETLESSDEDDTSPEVASAAVEPTSSKRVILFGLNPICDDLPERLPPTERVRTMLLDLYKQRVDCLYKILHWPTTLSDIEAIHSDPENATQSPSTQALEFAICFMALCSITDDEATQLDLGSRPALIQKYRVATELSISEANLIRAPNLTVLQAFVIYLIGLRTYQNCASEWTLLAIAVRTASALRLGQEDPAKFSTFDLELRRRLWYCIGLMDTHASLDRGTIPMLRWADIGPPPLCVNDEDMSTNSVLETRSLGFTEMSFFAMMFQSMVCYKKMCDIPAPRRSNGKKSSKFF